ncbi:hypothetical protein [Sorangium sp. So ce124]
MSPLVMRACAELITSWVAIEPTTGAVAEAQDQLDQLESKP